MAGRLAQHVLSAIGLSSAPFLLSETPYCLPAQSCYPSEQSLLAFNASIHGRLLRPDVPNFNCTVASCFSQEVRAADPGAAMFVNFEKGWGESELASPRGRTPEYAVNVQEPEDIVKAVEFARRYKLRLRVKSTGHDYLGRSSDEGSFSIWTHNLKKTRFDPSFLPHGAPPHYIPEKAVVAASGVQIQDLMEAADRAGVIVASGVSHGVGAAGGFAVNGGHGPLAPYLGLAVDNILEMTVVTAVGSIIKASPFINPDLFTALRGGGGPAFGIVLEVVFRAHDPPSGFVAVGGSWQIDQTASNATEEWKFLVREWIGIQESLSKGGFAGYTYLKKAGRTPFSYVVPSTDRAAVEAVFAPFFAYVASRPAITFERFITEEKNWYKMWSGAFHTALDSLDRVGINLLLGGRLIPHEVVTDAADELSEFLSSSRSPAIIHLVAGGAVAREPYFPTSVNPKWRQTLLHIDLPVTWSNTATPEQIKGIEKYLTAHVEALGKIARFSDGTEASYPSESDFNDENWQSTWYGDSYPKLLEAKKKWDPTGVFSARKVPGSEFVGY